MISRLSQLPLRTPTAGTAGAAGEHELNSRHRLFEAHVWKETLYLLLDLPVGVAGFTLVVTGLSLALGLAVTLVGIPLLAGTLLLARLAGRAERARARALLEFELAAPAPLRREKTVLARLFAPIRDSCAWRAAAYFTLMLPVGILTFTLAVAWWGAALTLLTLPAWAWALPHGGPEIANTGYYFNDAWQLALSTAVGLLLTLAATRVVHGLTFLDRGLLTLLRRPSD